MKIIRIFQIAFVILSTVACNNNQQKQTVQEIDTKTESSISLNNGNKWLVNKEMTPFIKASEELLMEYLTGNNNDFKGLAKVLKENNNKLITSCTMKGKSHDELHKWLHPHLELVKELETSKSQKNTKEIIEQMKVSFQMFNTYFQ